MMILDLLNEFAQWLLLAIIFSNIGKLWIAIAEIRAKVKHVQIRVTRHEDPEGPW